ncbi:BrnT family toxin [Klebsiella quasipneumoniae]|uniref:BrnT family toxin n=1 Tax=Klebsiella quasipneumoniae TaxID=1463165 RepID=UPI0012998652|nr:BrnT family toxin [Klebsiella quasipneumoniae]MRE39893.1 BrnT family toxin [Klebsiella quasipneumoniae]MRF90050.1 BrnT family toxin [Klebsiella quasipneumoniae]HCI6432838.1 BrnT family toxin [Klebsiella quasipneumoniae subsp. similipneumoniae]
MPMEFEWDANKALSNLRKHGVRFEEAVLVFDDPRHLSRQERFENGEYRWQTIGLVHGILVILVAHSIRFESGTEVIRIISARKADRKERNLYEHG